MSDSSIIPTINHDFVGKREYGLYPSPDAECVECGYPKNQHIEQCQSTATIGGQVYQCDLVPPHDGWGHQNREQNAAWT